MTDVVNPDSPFEFPNPRWCPRCEGPVPNAFDQGQFSGALSRADDATEVCSACGSDEAMQQHTEGKVTPKSAWPITRLYQTDRMVWMERQQAEWWASQGFPL